MPALKLRRIDLTASNAAAQIVKLRDQFRTDADISSGREQKEDAIVFGEALPPVRAGRAHLQRRARQGPFRSPALTPNCSTGVKLKSTKCE